MHATFATASFGAAKTHLRKARQARARGDLELFRQHVGIAAVKRETAKLLRRMATMNMVTRRQLIASWHKALKVANDNGAVILNHASAAGMLLDQHVSAHAALAKCPSESWWTRVRDYLQRVAIEEGDTMPPAQMAAGGGR